jgi:hypothetical protein
MIIAIQALECSSIPLLMLAGVYRHSLALLDSFAGRIKQRPELLFL